VNYIHRLQAEQAALNALRAEVRSFINYLTVDPKFNGTCPIDNSRKDWIATRDAITRLETMERQSYDR
jgi:hypothetical protein